MRCTPALAILFSLWTLTCAAFRPGVAAWDEPQPSSGPGQSLTVPGLSHLYKLDNRLYSGGTPEGIEGLESLKKLGVATIIRVDGARPDVAAIQKLGLRIVHLPIGYDGISADQSARLVRAVQESSGPVFIHCHHGQHRGPAAAALLARAELGWSQTVANQWLLQVGTSNRYPGLYQSGCRANLPGPEELAHVKPEDLPETARVPDLVERMVEIDTLHDQLKKNLVAGRNEAAHDPTRKAQLLLEALQEASRAESMSQPNPQKKREFGQRTSETISAIEQLIKALGTEKPHPDRISDSLANIGKSCSACHAAMRD